MRAAKRTSTVEPVLDVQGLTIEHKSGVKLLTDANLRLVPGEVVMLVGPSGSGKSTLINLLAGTISPEVEGWEMSGSLRFHNENFDLSRENVAVGGVIFQDFALFNELTVAQNLAIVEDHNDPVAPGIRAAIDGLLSGIRRENLIGECSGGQRQRVAIARTLMANHPILLMDEPNSGLDVVASAQLGLLIRQLAQEAGIAVVVVAHHFNELMKIADRALLLDVKSRNLIEMPANATKVDAALREAAVNLTLRPPEPPGPVASTLALLRRDPRRKKPEGRWGEVSRQRRVHPAWLLRYFGGFVWEHGLAPSSILFTMLGSVIIGFVTTWFIFQYLPFRDLLLPIIHSEALAGLAFTEIRVLAPLVTAVLLITRNAALIGSEIGHKVHSDQIRAMRNLHIPYRIYLTGNILAASVVATVVLVTLSVFVTSWVAMMTWAVIFPDDSTWLWRDQYFQRLRPAGVTLLVGTNWILVKAIPSVLGATGLALWFGYQPKKTTTEINLSIARALIWGMSFVLIWQAVLILIEFKQVSARLEATF
jgi:ABC-type multidrug transport system ATPase subunit/ABC-type transporter Mla maintaining outer membrane lipid asymmetry permease subunit MlaE